MAGKSENTPASSRLFLLVGMAGEGINLLALLVNNVLGPRWLAADVFGGYIKVLAPAFIAIGLVDAPLALRMFVVAEGELSRLVLRKLAATVALAGAIGLVTEGPSVAVLATLLIGGAYSFMSAAVHMALRRGQASLILPMSTVAMALMIAVLAEGGRSELTATQVASAQGGCILAVGAATYLTARWVKGNPYVQPENQVPTGILAVPVYLMGVVQWSLVAAVGVVDTTAHVALVRIATSITSAPATAVPLSGALLLVHSQLEGVTLRSARRTIGGAIALGLVIVVIGSALASTFVSLLGRGAYESLQPWVPVLLASGLGLMALYICWPLLVSRLVSPTLAKQAAIACLAAGAAVVASGGFGYRIGLIALCLLYGAVGLGTLTGTLLAIQRRIGEPAA